jgi:chromosome segregation ATPase
VSPYLQRNCPQCQKDLRVRAEYLNHRVICKHCQHTFTVTGAPAASGEASPPQTPGVAPRVEALEQELRHGQAALEAAQAELRTAVQQLEQREAQLEQARGRLQESEAVLEQARQQIQQGAVAAEQRDDALAERDRLRAEAGPLKERTARADALEKELAAERSIVAGLREELRTSQATFQTQAEATQTTLARVREERNHWKVEVERLNALVKEQEIFRQERDRLGSELADIRATGEQTAARLQAETQTVEELRSRLQALERLVEEATAGREQAQKTLAERVQRWDTERAALHREWETKLHDQQQNAGEQLRQHGEESDRDRWRWEQQTEEAQERSLRQVAALEAEIQRLTQESGERQRQEAAARERVEELVRERDQLAVRTEELQRCSTESEQRWQSETARLTNELDALGSSQAELRHDLEEARGQLGREQAALTTAAADACRQAATHREERDDALRWQPEAARLSDELGQALHRAEHLEKERDAAVARVGQAEKYWRAEIDALTEERNRAVQQHDEADQGDRDLEAQFQALSAQVDSLRQTEVQLRQNLAARELEVEAVREALAQARASAKEEFSQEKERLQTALALAQAQVARLRQALQALGIMIS